MDARAWLRDVMRKYRVRPEAADEILRHCDVTVLDADSVMGGGVVQYTDRPDRWHIVLSTAQHEAAVHEASHIWWFLHQNNDLVAHIIDQYHIQGDLRHKPRYKAVRQACYEGIHGNEAGWPGYWVGPPYNRWNADEMYAGLASLIMGDVLMLPPQLRTLYEGLFWPRETPRVYMPMVWG